MLVTLFYRLRRQIQRSFLRIRHVFCDHLDCVWAQWESSTEQYEPPEGEADALVMSLHCNFLQNKIPESFKWLIKLHFAFHLSYVSVVECWADYNKRVIPVFIGATVLGLILMAVLTHLFIRDRRRQGYDRLWACYDWMDLLQLKEYFTLSYCYEKFSKFLSKDV